MAVFLLYRILKTGRDERFDEIRGHFWKFAGFWVLQAMWVFGVSLPLTLLNSPNVTDRHNHKLRTTYFLTDYLGLIIFLFGFFTETIADLQKVPPPRAHRKWLTAVQFPPK
jgi:steroid 5-alpha reductase family enzyme